MAKRNDRGSYEISGLFQSDLAIMSIPTCSTILGQGQPIMDEQGNQMYSKIARTTNTDIIHNSIVTSLNEYGAEQVNNVLCTINGELMLSVAEQGSYLPIKPMITLNGRFVDYDIPVGSKVCDPKAKTLGDWLVVSPTEAVYVPEEGKNIFGSVAVLGSSDQVLDDAKKQMFTVLFKALDRDQFEYSYDKVEETLKNDELYIDEQEKKAVLDDLKAGKELAEAVEENGGSRSAIEKIRESTVEFGNEFASHASKFAKLAKSIGGKVKDFFNKRQLVTIDEIKSKGIDEETAHALHDTAELRAESRESLEKLGKTSKEMKFSLKERGIFALADVAKKISDLKLDHYNRLASREEKHIESALDRIRARSAREGNVKYAEMRVKQFISNVGRSVANAAAAITNAVKYVHSQVRDEVLEDFDVKPYHPMLEAGDIQVTRSALSTALYRHDDNRLINSSLHLAQIKAKIFSEQIAATPVMKRAEVADKLIGEMAEKIGKGSMADRKIDFAMMEGFPARMTEHTLELTDNGVVIDGENMTEKGYAGISSKLSPNAIMHLYVEAQKEEIVYKLGLAERVAPEIVQALNVENERMLQNIDAAYDNNENSRSTMSDIHKEFFNTQNVLNNGYTFADKLQEREDALTSGEDIDEEDIGELVGS